MKQEKIRKTMLTVMLSLLMGGIASPAMAQSTDNTATVSIEGLSYQWTCTYNLDADGNATITEIVPVGSDEVTDTYTVNGQEYDSDKWRDGLSDDEKAAYDNAILGGKGFIDFTFPTQVDGHPVTSIRSKYSYDGTNVFGVITPIMVKSIVVPQGVTSLGDHCFQYAYNVESISLPEGLTSIGTSALSTAWNNGKSGGRLTELTIPSTVKSLGDACVGYVTSLGKVTFAQPSQLQTLGANCFINTAITEITIPASVTTMDDFCFSGCTSLTTVTFDDIENSKLQSLGRDCFGSTTSLESIVIPMQNLVKAGNATTSNYNNSYTVFYGSNSNLKIALYGQPTKSFTANYYKNLLGTSKQNSFNSVSYPREYASSYSTLTKIPEITSTPYVALSNVKASSKYGTVCVPYTLSASTCVGITAFYEEANVSGTGITLSRATTLTAGKPYIFEQAGTTADDGTFTATDASGLVVFAVANAEETAATTVANGTYLKGTFEAKSDATNAYVLQDGAFVKNGSVDANTAYLDFSYGDVATLAADFGGFSESSTTLAVTPGTDTDGNATLAVSIPAIAGLPSYTTSTDEATHSLMPAMATDDSGNTTYTFDITDGDYTSFKTTTEKSGVSLNYTRTFKAVGWYSWYMPFQFTMTDGLLAKVKIAYPVGIINESEDDASTWQIGVVALKEGESANANACYFVKPLDTDGSTATEMEITNATLKATSETTFTIQNSNYNFTFGGNYSDRTFTDGWWGMSNNGSGFIQASGNSSRIRPMRFYMDMTERTDNPYAQDNSSTSGAKFSIVEFADEATAIRAINKAVERGRGKVYDLQGRRVTKPVRGLYIQDGKKVLVR